MISVGLVIGVGVAADGGYGMAVGIYGLLFISPAGLVASILAWILRRDLWVPLAGAIATGMLAALLPILFFF